MSTIYRFFTSVLVIVFLLALSPATHAAQPEPLSEKEILSYLDQSITWRGLIDEQVAQQTRPSAVLIGTTLQQNVLAALRLSFDFARIQATDLDRITQKQDAPASDPTSKKGIDLQQARLAVQQKNLFLESQIKETQLQSQKAKGEARDLLRAKNEKLTAELGLAQAQLSLIDQVTTQTPTEKKATLVERITALAASIPELEMKKKSAKTLAANANDPATAQKEIRNDSKGLIRLGSDVIDAINQAQDINEIASQTTRMITANDEMIARLRAELVTIVKRSQELGQEDTLETAALLASQKELQEMTLRFQTLGQTLVPLTEQRRLLELAQTNVTEWQELFSKNTREAFQRLLWRLSSLILAIALPLFLSEMVRRAGLKYVSDVRHRRQLTTVRRVVFWFILFMILLVNLLTEFKSLVTILGFMTAGLAVALQNVILSSVAYFFYFGRYGIRVGSRVTIGDVTGEVIETGLVHLYLIELKEKEGQWQATGRIVAFPNNVIFQANGFYKHVPGVKFPQHEMVFWLPKDTDRTVAQGKLKEAAQILHEDNKPLLEVQRTALEKATHIRTKVPRPKGSLVIEDTRLGFAMSYPIPADQAAASDERAKRTLLDILEREPKLARLSDEPELR